MSILVIGGTGTLGRQIVKRALDEGYQVKCLVRDFRRAAFLKDWGADLIYGDLSIPSTIPTALKGINVIIDSSTIRSTSSYTSETIDWKGKIALIEAAELVNMKKFISFSFLNAAKNKCLLLLALFAFNGALIRIRAAGQPGSGTIHPAQRLTAPVHPPH